ncbi:unnamed protein product [Amaranthus hypochondriacus]
MAGNKSFEVMLFAVMIIILSGTINCRITSSDSEFSVVYPTPANECFTIGSGACNANTCGVFYCKHKGYNCVGDSLCCCHH